jgi:hypothetical protein
MVLIARVWKKSGAWSKSYFISISPPDSSEHVRERGELVCQQGHGHQAAPRWPSPRHPDWSHRWHVCMFLIHMRPSMCSVAVVLGFWCEESGVLSRDSDSRHSLQWWMMSTMSYDTDLDKRTRDNMAWPQISSGALNVSTTNVMSWDLIVLAADFKR